MTTLAEAIYELRNKIRDGWVRHDDIIPTLTALAERAEKVRVPSGLSATLDEYERQTKQLPNQHEIPSRGCCTYNWRMAVIRDLRAMLATAPEPPKDALLRVDKGNENPIN